MAKFSIALCILLVACGALGTSVFLTAVKTWMASIATAQNELESGLATAISLAESFEDKASSIAKAIIANWETEMTELEDAYEDVSTCAASSANVTELVEELASDVISCVDTSLSTIKSDVTTIIADLTTLSSTLQSVIESAESCSTTDILTYASCIATLTAEVSSDYTSQFTALMTDVATINTDLSDFSTTLESCGLESGMKTVLIEAATAYTEIVSCLKNSTSSA